ncbi:MAG: patatin-like phospholipase family protein [Elusimicrobiota bacterium]|nr:MAG: patatin-like phospholipase family protein [Elusimicrobiota bacterium]
MTARGARFDRVMGFSIGALNGSALAFGRLDDALARWRRLDWTAIRPRPRLFPFSLCSTEPLRAFLDHAADEEEAKARLAAELTIVTACPADGAPVNATYAPGGSAWDGPLVEHAAASCAIPAVFPPVDLVYRGRALRLVDGGVPMRRPLDFSPLAASADVLVLEMVRADEVGLRFWTPWRSVEQACRVAARRLVDDGIRPLPRVLRLAPSKRLEPLMLDFRSAGISRMLAQGAADAEAFLAAPESYRVR